MVWFKVDDRFHTSEPVKKIPKERRAAAVGLWTLAGTWSSQFLKNGAVPAHMLEDLGGTTDQASDLVKVGLWKKTRGGYAFTNWAEWQVTREQVETAREAERNRKAEWRAAKAAKTGTGHAGVPRDTPVRPVLVPSTQTRPDPTRPDQIEEAAAERRGTRLPDGFAVTEAMKQWATVNASGVDIDRSTQKFINYWTAKTGQAATKRDWILTWRNWLMTDSDRNASKPTPTQRAQRTVMLATDLPEVEQ